MACQLLFFGLFHFRHIGTKMIMPEIATISRLYNVMPADSTPHASHIHNMTSMVNPILADNFIERQNYKNFD